MRRKLALLLACLVPAGAGAAPSNVLLFVADGLRPGAITAHSAPAMAALLQDGTRFANAHSVFPTFTTANASALATGHLLGDTGDFSNVPYAGRKIAAAGGTVVPFLESDPVITEMNAAFGGNYLGETGWLAAARQAGYCTAAIGKVGPTHLFDATDTGGATILLDDQTGTPKGMPLSPAAHAALQAAGLPDQAPARNAAASAGTASTPGTTQANITQQEYFLRAATDAVLPLCVKSGKPFVLVYWSRDPDITQHTEGDSFAAGGRNPLTPGINGPTVAAAIANADGNLRELRTALVRLGVARNTDIVLASDHGFSTISKQSSSSATVVHSYMNTRAGELPRGFVALELALALNLPLFDATPAQNGTLKRLDPARDAPSMGNGKLGDDPANPQIVVAANGGSDLIYVRPGDRSTLERIVGVLSAQDYTSGLFADDAFGAIPGTLKLSDIGMKGAARTPTPSLVVNFRSFDTGCADRQYCGVEVADTILQQGQGMHGGFGREDTLNVEGAIGPDFKAAFADSAPSSNADIGVTIAHVLGLRLASRGTLAGRVLAEALTGGAMPEVRAGTTSSAPDKSGNVTVLRWQAVGAARYFDVAGYVGRTNGL